MYWECSAKPNRTFDNLETPSGSEIKFAEGYKRHLDWHKQNNDLWNWYGWYFISGPRTMQFLDATFGHTWSDFDKAIKPAEDLADNLLNTIPHAAITSTCKFRQPEYLSIGGMTSLKSRLLRYVTISTSDPTNTFKVIQSLKESYLKEKEITDFPVYQLIDGGNINEIICIIGCKTSEEFGKTEDLREAFQKVQKNLKVKGIVSIISETLAFRPDMSINIK